MNRLLYAATIFVAGGVSAVGAHAWTVSTTDRPAPTASAAPAAPPQPPTGRYVLYMSTLNARDVFMLDTVTGKVWQRATFTDLVGQPTAWDYMDRIDNVEELSAFAAANGPAKPMRKTK